MKIALFSTNTGVCATREGLARVAPLAEQLGFESLWAGEHMVLPSPRVPPSPMEPGDAMLDPVATLTFIAALTERVRLGTGVLLLPQRNPVALAKELASLDVLSNGRTEIGIGVGYLEPEMAALGVPYHQRGARTDEFLAAMRSIWHEEHPAFEGRFVRFAGVQAHPKPARLPIVVGGHTEAAFRRSVQSAHGWYGFSLDLERTAACLEGLREAASRHERPADLGELEISVTPPDTPDADAVARFAELGVHRLIVRPRWGVDEEGMVAFVTQIGEALIARE
jgi:probable F420-dependent oxidoreductase